MTIERKWHFKKVVSKKTDVIICTGLRNSFKSGDVSLYDIEGLN